MELIRTSTMLALVIMSLFLLVSNAHAQNETQENDKTPVKLDVYKSAIPVKRVPPKYPLNAAKNGQEAWVDFNFMVGTSGETYEVEVADHSFGGEAFINTATEAVSNYVYKPAILGSNTVDSSNSIRVRFEMETYRPETSNQFNFRYREFREALEKKNQPKSLEHLKELASIPGLSLFEDAYINLAHFRYEQQFGTPEGQLRYLSRTVLDKSQEKHFRPDAYTKLLATLFSLQAQQAYLSEALDTFDRLVQRENAGDLAKQFIPAATKIINMKTDQTAYALSGAINQSNSWGLKLFKPVFAVTKLDGEIDEIKLYCSYNYVFFKFEQDKQYEIPETYGHCNLSLIGKPNSTFELVQLARS